MRRTKRRGGAAFNISKKSKGKSIVHDFITAVKPNETKKMKEGYYTIINFTIPRDPTLYVAKGIYLGIWENRIYLGTYELDPRPRWTQPDPYRIPLSNVKSILQMPAEGPFASILPFSDPRLGRSRQEAKRAKNENNQRRRKNAENAGLYQNNWNIIT